MPSPLEDVVENALLGSTTWVEEMCKVLADEGLDGNVPTRGKLVWRPSLEQIESVTAEEFGVDVEVLQAKRVRNNEARALALCLIRRLTRTDKYAGDGAGRTVWVCQSGGYFQGCSTCGIAVRNGWSLATAVETTGKTTAPTGVN